MNLLIFIFLLLACIVLAIAIGVPILIYKWCKKLRTKGNRKAANVISVIFISIVFFVAYLTITAIYPNDSFYKDDFKTQLGIDFPKSGDIIYKDASYPDIHGHYISACSFELNVQDYQQLRKTFQGNSPYCSIGRETDYVLHHYNEKNIIQVCRKVVDKSTSYLLFMNDNKTVIYFLYFDVTGC